MDQQDHVFIGNPKDQGFFQRLSFVFLGDISLVFDLNQSSSVEIFFAYILCSVVQVILFQKHSFTSSLSHGRRKVKDLLYVLTHEVTVF